MLNPCVVQRFSNPEPPLQRLRAFIRENTQLQALATGASHLVALQKTWADAVPLALRPYTRAAGLSRRRITVLADNGAVAAKLKLLAPTLLKHLQIKGLEVTSIRVEVQVNSGPAARRTSPRVLPESAAHTLECFALNLPDSALRSTLQRLAKRHPVE